MEKGKDQLISILESKLEANERTICALMERVESSLSTETNAFSEFGNSVLLAKKIQERSKELENATKKLEIAGKYTSAIIDSLIDNLIVIDYEGKIKDLNQHTCLSFGESRSNLLDINIASVLKFLDNSSFEDFILEIKNKNVIKIQEVNFCTSNQKIIPCSLSASILKSTSIDRDLIILLVRDISDLKEMQNSIEEAREKSLNSAKLASLGEMAGGVAHEINNPLAIISGTAMILKREAIKGPVQKEVVDKFVLRIEDTVKRIVRIVQGLKNISRADGEFKLNRVLLRDVLEDLLGLCGEKFRSHGVDLQLEIENQDEAIFCERVQFSQVLLNLISNAYDAIIDSEVPQKWIRISARMQKDNFTMKIENSGEKIPLEIQSKIFNPFFTSKDIGKGTGLGLSLSKSIIDLHKGRLELLKDEASTCFEIAIPNKILKECI